jgi:hypothetical protein
MLRRTNDVFTTQNEEAITEESVEELFKMWHINTMASSE